MPVRYCCKYGQTLHNPTLVFCRQIQAEEMLIPGETTDAHRGCQRPHEYIEAIAARVRHLCHNQSALKKGFDYLEDNKIACLSLSYGYVGEDGAVEHPQHSRLQIDHIIAWVQRPDQRDHKEPKKGKEGTQHFHHRTHLACLIFVRSRDRERSNYIKQTLKITQIQTDICSWW